MTEPKSSNLTFESRIGQPAKNRRDRTGERFGDWKVTGYGGSNGHDSWWHVENTVTGERAEKFLTNLVGFRKRAEAREAVVIVGQILGPWLVVKKLASGRFECEGDGVIVRLTYRQLLAFDREEKKRQKKGENR